MPPSPPPSPPSPSETSLPASVLLQAAGLLERRVHRALAGSEGAGPDAELTSLYAAPLGAALLSAGLAAVSEDAAGSDEATGSEGRGPAQRSLDALAPLLDRLDRAPGAGAIDPAVGVGGFHGLGAAVYGLACVGDLLDRPDLLEAAVEAAAGIDEERLAADEALDVVFGSAGALLALLALERILERRDGANDETRSALVDRAEACAGRLLEHRAAPPDGGPRGWAASEVASRRLQSGFAHGAAGIVHALVALHGRRPDPRLLEAAREGVAFEERLERPELGGWLPFWAPSADGLHLMNAWCRGAPGIALGRLASRELLALETAPERDLAAALGDDARAALERTLALEPTAEDHLCCGNLGRALVLERAARSAADSRRWRAAAGALAGRVLGRAKARGGFGWTRSGPFSAPEASFLKGAAGGGFALLTLARGASLPCPLLLEPRSTPEVADGTVDGHSDAGA